MGAIRFDGNPDETLKLEATPSKATFFMNEDKICCQEASIPIGIIDTVIIIGSRFCPDREFLCDPSLVTWIPARFYAELSQQVSATYKSRQKKDVE